MNRRELLKISAGSTLAALAPGIKSGAILVPAGPFRFCLNTSTIMGQKPGLIHSIEIAAMAGYDGVELWVSDVLEYLEKGGSIRAVASLLHTKKLKVENAISFTEWLVDDDARRAAALITLENEMQLMRQLGCRRIAAPPAGLQKDQPLNIQKAGEHYRYILNLGRKYDVMPLLEFWGASGTIFNLGQALAIAAAANDADARILPDVYHLFRGGSGFESLHLLNGKVIDIIHMNDYPGNKPIAEQTDADRVYPGDGAAPFKQILRTLHAMGGTKVLSLELFNKTYWQQDALEVARTGLHKMKTLVQEIM